MQKRVWAEIDLDALRFNFGQLRKLVAPARLLGVVKSEAYGHGLLPVAHTLAEEGCWGLGIITAGEGLRLRRSGLSLPLVILGPTLGEEMQQAIDCDLTVAVYSLEQAKELSRIACHKGKKVKVHVKVDTGLGRLSEWVHKAPHFIERLKSLPGLELEGIYSHLADAEGLDQRYTLLQFGRFKSCIDELAARGIRFKYRHLSGSAAGMLLREARFDLVRAGISLYGLWPAEETRLLLLSRGQDLLELVNLQFDNPELGEFEILRPVLSFKTVVVQVKSVPRGCLVGYGCTYEAKRDTLIAVLPVGYAEGYDRHLSNCGEVLIRGRRCPVLGRVCMNMTVVDVTDTPGVEAGDEVVLIGKQGRAAISADEVAAKVGTINYEIVTRIPVHVPRIYRGRIPRSLKGGAIELQAC